MNLLPETAYTYRLRAYNTLGNSDYSDTITVTTLETPAAMAFNGPHVIPGTTQAEDFDNNQAGIGYFDIDPENQGGEYRSTGVDIEACTDTDGGYNVDILKMGNGSII